MGRVDARKDDDGDHAVPDRLADLSEGLVVGQAEGDLADGGGRHDGVTVDGRVRATSPGNRGLHRAGRPVTCSIFSISPSGTASPCGRRRRERDRYQAAPSALTHRTIPSANANDPFSASPYLPNMPTGSPRREEACAPFICLRKLNFNGTLD